MGLRYPAPAIDQMYQMQKFDVMIMFLYSLLHLESHFISMSNLNLPGLFWTERGKSDLEN